MGPISLSAPLLQTALSTALQSVGLTGKTTPTSTSSLSASSSTGPQDNSQLSPFAQLLNTLQQLKQSNPTKYAQVTQQIGANLQSAAQTATSSGNTAAASQLSQLATDFTNASKSGQLPNVQDLAQAMGGGHHHHHASSTDASSSTASASSSSTSSSSSSASQALSQMLSAFQSNGAQSAATDPMSIIMNTLLSAGVTGSTS